MAATEETVIYLNLMSEKVERELPEETAVLRERHYYHTIAAK